MSSVTIKNVRKNYGTLEVVHGINLTIEDGSFVVLLGPSGCGKSTLLRMIAGLESVTGGDIEIQGRRVNDVHPKDRNIAMVFQNYALYAHMKVKDNMSFSLQLAKRPQSEIDEKVKWAAKILAGDSRPAIEGMHEAGTAALELLLAEWDAATAFARAA